MDTPGSPQSLATNWLINEDGAFLCPDDPFLTQRYAAAVFYYSTEGDRWNQCSAPANVNDPAQVAEANAACTIQVEGMVVEEMQSGSDAWLTPSSECQWGGLACSNDDSFVIQLAIGEKYPQNLEL